MGKKGAFPTSADRINKPHEDSPNDASNSANADPTGQPTQAGARRRSPWPAAGQITTGSQHSTATGVQVVFASPSSPALLWTFPFETRICHSPKTVPITDENRRHKGKNVP
ncbi:uncharacterized protein ACIQIH_012888 isoform 1-T1 [Cyanocitta cristata]